MVIVIFKVGPPYPGVISYNIRQEAEWAGDMTAKRKYRESSPIVSFINSYFTEAVILY
jgi:hypothetical protein